MPNYKIIRGSIMLVVTAMIWGVAFVAQSVGMDYMPPITFNCVRCIIGGIVLLPVAAIFGEKKKKRSVHSTKAPEPRTGRSDTAGETPAVSSVAETSAEIYIGSDGAAAGVRRSRRDLWLGGALCGVVLFFASTLQQIGLIYTSAGKAGFITALYIVIVPALGLLFGRRASFTVWAGASVAVIGLYLLSVKEDFTVGAGDLLILLCAFCFSVHIMLISHFSPRCDGVKMSCIQFFVAGALGIAPMLTLEQPTVSGMLAGWLPILYAGVMSCGVAYTLQIVAQRDVKETVASLLMSLESVFAALTGWLVLHERLSFAETVGCVLIFAAVLLAQIPPTRIRLPARKK